jgi:hypothetical protein
VYIVCAHVGSQLRHFVTTHSEHLSQRQLTVLLADCPNFGRLRWLFYYLHTYRQFQGKFKTAALLKPYFLITTSVTKTVNVLPSQPTQHVISVSAHSSTTQVSIRRHSQTLSRMAHFAQRLVNQGPADRTTPAQRRSTKK